MIYTTRTGLLIRGEPLEPQPVTLVIWSADKHGGVTGGIALEEPTNDLGRAEAMAREAGYELRGPAKPWRTPLALVGVAELRVPGGIYVPVYAKEVADAGA